MRWGDMRQWPQLKNDSKIRGCAPTPAQLQLLPASSVFRKFGLFLKKKKKAYCPSLFWKCFWTSVFADERRESDDQPSDSDYVSWGKVRFKRVSRLLTYSCESVFFFSGQWHIRGPAWWWQLRASSQSLHHKACCFLPEGGVCRSVAFSVLMKLTFFVTAV